MGIFCIVSVLSINRYVFLVTFPVFITVSSIAAFFTWRYDISVNPALIESIRYTNAEEVSSYLSGSLVGIILLSLIVSGLIVHFRYKLIWKRIDLIVVGLVFIVSSLSFTVVNKIRYNTLTVRSPFSFYSATKLYLSELKEVRVNRIMLGSGSVAEVDSLITVLVIGEALRADHVQMNGYHRETMPNMEERGVISFPNVYSPYTHTASSLMYILSRASDTITHPMYNESSFIDIFKSAKFETAWIGNQNPVKTFKYFVNESDYVFINKPQFSDYSNTKKLDTDLIVPFSNFVSKENTRKLIILHISGNHWWYNKNFPDTFAFYTPILENKVLSPSNRERMINSYDNATLFTDFVLEQIIKQIEGERSLLIFLSDHGQSFGEEGKWLHANNTAAEKNPACFVWMSDKYQQTFLTMSERVKINRNLSINTDFLFHSIINGSAIQTPYLDLSKSIFSAEFQQEKGNID
jgi:glucan phosphoethanolaminetransferase (alkaline phosphatase superfamily)